MKFSHGETGQSGDGVESPPAPDFGLALKARGWSPTAPVDFPLFQFDELGVLGPGQYTAMMMTAFGSVGHALSLDFGPEILQGVLALAPPAVRTVITKELARDGATPRRIALPAPIRCGISAILGEVQRTARESFLPLVVRAVYPRWDEHSRRHPAGPIGQPVRKVNTLRSKGRRAGLAGPRLSPGSRKALSP
jgi:hypothetical protein